MNMSSWKCVPTLSKGHRIVAQIPGMEEVAEIILSHEEYFDGTDYPRGLKGQ